MAKRPALSKAEIGVARTLWELGRASAREVVEAMPEELRRDFSTIQTYLSRLETKGYVSSTLVGRTKFFTAKVKPTQVLNETINDFVDRLFAGRSLSLVKHLIDEGHVSQGELDELRTLLSEIENDSAKSN